MEFRVKIQRIALICVYAILLLFLLTGCWGDPGTRIRVNNLTDQTLTIFIDELQEYDIPPGDILAFGTTLIYPKNIYPDDKKFLIEAKTKNGEVVYSDNFSWQELDDMEWTIVIPATP